VDLVHVVISRGVPVPRWPLSELGKQRMRAGLQQPWVREVTSVYCSAEQKAIDGAAILAEHLSLPFHEVDEQSMLRAVSCVPLNKIQDDGTVAIVSHGAVGTLLYCHLAGEAIARRWDQPPNGGGNYYRFTLSPRAAHFWWRAFDG
jgi:broad specificity phosphatase PhoE